MKQEDKDMLRQVKRICREFRKIADTFMAQRSENDEELGPILNEPLNEIKAKRVATTEWAPGVKGLAPLRVVLWEKIGDASLRRCGVHYEILQPNGAITLWDGKYNLSAMEASGEFIDRKRAISCEWTYGRVFSSSIKHIDKEYLNEGENG